MNLEELQAEVYRVLEASDGQWALDTLAKSVLKLIDELESLREEVKNLRDYASQPCSVCGAR